MEIIYAQHIDDQIKQAIVDARNDGRRISEIVLTADEFSELKSIVEDIEIGGKYKGCVISIGG